MFSQTLRRAFTAAFAVLAIIATANLSLARDNGNGNPGRGPKKNDPSNVTRISVSVPPPSKGMADRRLGNYGTTGNNSAQPINQGNPRSEAMARDSKNGNGYGHGKDNVDPGFLPLFPTISFSAPSKGMADRRLGNHATSGNNPAQPINQGNPGSEAMSALVRDTDNNSGGSGKGHGKDKVDPLFISRIPVLAPPSKGMADPWLGNHATSGNNAEQPIHPDNPSSEAMSGAFGSRDLGSSAIARPVTHRIFSSRASITEAPVAASSILPRILEHSSFQVSRDGGQGLQAGGAWTLSF